MRMNYLAHIYLSGTNTNIQIGNFIADGIKGKSYLAYPPEIQTGIILHRKIDSFTDTHKLVYQSAHRFFDEFRHYNMVIIDVVFDHFLAKNWEIYHDKSLGVYAADFYQLLKTNFEILPDRIKNLYPIMVKENWLTCYASLEGLHYILSQMSKRIKREISLQNAVKTLEENYTLFEDEFKLFFDELKIYTQTELLKLQTEI